MKTIKITLLSTAALLTLSACANLETEAKYPTSAGRELNEDNIYEDSGGIFGKGGIFGSNDKESSDEGGNIGVNTYLWRASLDTVSFMPLATADPFGGTILTDWYEDPETPGERFKLNVLILSRELKADGVRVRVFKQAAENGQWKDVPTSDSMGRKLEDSILTRARQMRAKKLGPLG